MSCFLRMRIRLLSLVCKEFFCSRVVIICILVWLVVMFWMEFRLYFFFCLIRRSFLNMILVVWCRFWYSCSGWWLD